MPANVIAVQNIVFTVINFQVVDKSTLSSIIIEPLFGGDSEKSQSSDSFKDQSLLLQILQLLLGMAVAGLLIALLVLCKVKLLPHCCMCFQKLVNFAMAKLMFNSLLRALMQTYLQTCLSTWFSLRQTSLETSSG